MNSNTYYYSTTAFAVVLLVASLVGGIRMVAPNQAAVVDSITGKSIPLPVEARENSPDYKFTNPILFTESDQRLFTEYDDFDKVMSLYIQDSEKKSLAESISVYLRDVNTGHWTGVNQDEKYQPSSLLKVAVAISYFRSAVASSNLSSYSIDSFLQGQLYYPGKNDEGQYYKPSNALVPGYYSMKDLIENMIRYSDNVAMNVLINNNGDEFNKVYQDFRLPASIDNGTSDYMTARSYSVLFRTLYNSTYLPWDVSEHVLGMLASTTFDRGLVAGVPSGLVISHKFGEHTNIRPSGGVINRELHDCGIIYYPGHPYFLCIMTRGQDFTKLESVLKTVSKMAYDFVDRVTLQNNRN